MLIKLPLLWLPLSIWSTLMGSKQFENNSFKNLIQKIYFVIDFLKKYVIWHLISSEGDCLGGYLPSPYPLRHSGISRVQIHFLTSGCSLKFSVSWSLCYRESPCRSQIHIIVFTLVSFPRAVVLSCVLPIFLYYYFLKFLYFLITIQLFYITFLQMLLVYSEGYPTKETFLQHPLGSHFEVFCG